MNKTYMTKAPDDEVIMDYIKTYSRIVLDTNMYGRPLKTISKHLEDLNSEMIKRGLLTQEQVDKLNM